MFPIYIVLPRPAERSDPVRSSACNQPSGEKRSSEIWLMIALSYRMAPVAVFSTVSVNGPVPKSSKSPDIA